MKKFAKFLVLTVMVCSLLITGASAASDSFDVSVVVNGSECRTANIGVAVSENSYTFELEDLLSTLGLELTYDEATSTVTLSAPEEESTPSEEKSETSAWWAFPQPVTQSAASDDGSDWWAFPEPIEAAPADTSADADWWAFPEPVV